MFGEYPGNLLRRQKSVESILGGQLRCGPLRSFSTLRLSGKANNREVATAMD